MKNEDYASLIEAHGIKPTANRIVVARTLAGASRPLSLSELERRIVSIDKSNVFRALTLFREHHLVHAIADGGGVRYELCHSHDHDHDDDTHAHFFCERCRRTFCLDNTAIPAIALPKGYTMTTATFLVKGICADCQRA